MTDQRIQYTEKMVGAGHPTLSDTLNRFSLVEHNNDGTHKNITLNGVAGKFLDDLFDGGYDLTVKPLDVVAKGPHIDIRAFLPAGYVTDGTVDYSTQVQAALDYAVTLGSGGGRVIVPSEFTKLACNVTIPSRVWFEGMNPDVILIPASNAPIIKFKQNGYCVRAGVRNFVLDGTATQGSYTSQDGILLQPDTGYWTDTITLEYLTIKGCGKRGLAMIGVNSSRFVQNVYTNQVKIINCMDSGLYQAGMVIEVFHDLMFCTDNGSASVDAQSNISFALNTESVRRTIFRNLVANISGMATGNACYLAHAREITFLGGDFEESPAAVKIQGALTNNISFRGTRFGDTTGMDKAIWVLDCDGLAVDGCRFDGTITTAIDCQTNTSASRVKRVYITPSTTFGPNITNPLLILKTYTLSTGAVSVDISRKRLIIDTEGAAATDDLVNLYASDGANPKGDWDGYVVILSVLNAARTVNVTSAGNIALSISPFALDNTADSITLMWNSSISKWVEIARSDNGV